MSSPRIPGLIDCAWQYIVSAVLGMLVIALLVAGLALLIRRTRGGEAEAADIDQPAVDPTPEPRSEAAST